MAVEMKTPQIGAAAHRLATGRSWKGTPRAGAEHPNLS
jgi:hypothetical protein